MCSGSIRPEPPKPFEMILDSPFLFIIADNVLKLPVFVGIVVNPQED
jgi:serine protease inhibitor